MGFIIKILVKGGESYNLGKSSIGHIFMLNFTQFMKLLMSLSTLDEEIKQKFLSFKKIWKHQKKMYPLEFSEKYNEFDHVLINNIRENALIFCNKVKDIIHINMPHSIDQCNDIIFYIDNYFKNKKNIRDFISDQEKIDRLTKIYCEKENDLIDELVTLSLEKTPKLSELNSFDFECVLRCAEKELNIQIIKESKIDGYEQFISIEITMKYIRKYSFESIEQTLRTSFRDPRKGIIVDKIDCCFLSNFDHNFFNK